MQMAHFMVNLPLSKPKIIEEIRKIVEIGEINGFCESKIMDIIQKYQRKILTEFSSFYDNAKPEEEARS